jgi:phosphoribosyl-ATP pyrophosphohydrolase/phosphoribosyl-AMP cyclohydrolase
MLRPGETFEELERMIVSRRGEPIERSYTAKLLHAGANKIGGKVVEESGELAMAGVSESDDRVVSECADLFYHVLVLLACRDVPLAAVTAELARRFGTSGLDEKASRGSQSMPEGTRE